MDQVRTRARRRTLGQAATVAGLVAVALVGGGVAVAQTRHDAGPPPAAVPSISVAPSASVPPSPSVRPSSSAPAPVQPSRPPARKPSTDPAPPSSEDTPPKVDTEPPITKITPAMMLQPEDVGTGYTMGTEAGGDWTYEFGASNLQCPRTEWRKPIEERGRSFHGDPAKGASVLQQTRLHEKGAAARYLASVRSKVAACSPPGGQTVHIAAEGFAGDESLLVVFTQYGGYVAKNILVRKGDVLTEIGSKPSRSDKASLALAAKAAARF
ncbi:hypothetical protein [Actinoplanes sp. NPDC051859]|uniref:hypothetical protein n=1 Tax=Actinoplanes sp. NPDC051859 TaxID=3363909 RepID=UPI0037B6B587